MKSNKGSALLFIMTALAIFMTLFITYLGYSSNDAKRGTAMQRQAHIATIFRTNALSLIRSSGSWQLTRTDQAFNCVTDRSCQRGQAPIDMRIFDGSGEIYGESGRPLNSSAKICSADDLTSIGNCTLAFDIKWQPICESETSCVLPRILITGKLIIVPGRTGPMIINPSNYKFTITRTP